MCPGFIQTDFTPVNNEQAPLTADEAARIVFTAATLPDDAESGTFIDQDGPGSVCEAASWTSRNGAPASSAAVMKACRSVCGVTFLSSPAAYLAGAAR